MATQGNLSEVSIPELFQFLQQHAKTGCVTVSAETAGMLVYFQDGMIVGVCLKEHVEPMAFWCDMLSTAGYFTDEQIELFKRKRSHELVTARHILISEGILSEREIEELLQRYSQGLLLSALKLQTGQFCFATGQIVPEDLRLTDPIAVDAFLLEGLRMVDELPMLRKHIGSLRRVPRRRREEIGAKQVLTDRSVRKRWLRNVTRLFQKTPHAEAPGAGLVDVRDQMTPQEREVYSRIDGIKSVKQIIEESMQGEYLVCKALLSLAEKGWIDLGTVSIEAGRPGSPPRDTSSRVLIGSAAWVGMAMVVAALHLVSADGLQGAFLWRRVEQGWNTVLAQPFNQKKMQAVVHALELYRMEHGAYPETLDTLIDQRFLREADVGLRGHGRYSYHLKKDGGYELRMFSEGESTAAGE